MSTLAFALWFGDAEHLPSLANDRVANDGIASDRRAAPAAGNGIGQSPDADRELVARIHAGELDAFESLFRRLLDPLVDFACMLGVSREGAQDIVGDVFYGVWKNRERWEPAHLRAYFFGAVRKRVQSEQQRARRTLPLSSVVDDIAHASAFVDHGASADGATAENELIARLEASLDKMPPLRRTVITLRLREQLSYAEIATALGMGENAAQAHGSRAMKAIREAFAEPEGAQNPEMK